MKLLVRLFSTVLFVVVMLVMLAVIPGVTAQNPTATPTLTPTAVPLPACQLFHLTVAQAAVRACAGTECRIEAGVTGNDELCVLGVAENPGWLMVNLDPQNPDSPVRYVSADVVAPGPVGMTEDVECQPWIVTASEAILRQCGGEGCAVVGGLPRDTLICVKDYGGQWGEWLYVDYSSVSDTLKGWMFDELAEPVLDDTVVISPSGMGAAAQDMTPPPFDTPTPTLPVCAPGIGLGAAEGVEVPAYAAEYPYHLLYSVRSGDTLLGLVQQFDSTLVVVREANQLNTAGTIVVGQRLLIPVRAPVPGYEVQLIAPSPEAGLDCVTATPTPILAAAPLRSTSGPFIAQDLALTTFQVSNIELSSPRGAALFGFSVPSNWLLDGNNVLYLNAEYYESIPGNASATPSMLVSTFKVYLDGELISTVTLSDANIGPQTLIIPLPSNLVTVPDQSSYTMQFVFEAQDHCYVRAASGLFIRTDLSYFHFEYHNYYPRLDLAQYPDPFWVGALGEQPETVLMVLPDGPSEADIQAAAGISTALGQLTWNALEPRVVQASELTDTLRRDNNLMLIGRIGDHPVIDELYAANALLTSVQDGVVSFDGEALPESEGIIQLLSNPANDMKAIGVITGVTDEALMKAAQALSGPPSILGLGGPLALISDTRDVGRVPAGTRVESHVTFADLGVGQLVLTGVGSQVAEVRFVAPSGAQLAPDASVDLMFNYAGTFGSGSTVTLLMNNTPLASAFLGTSSRDGQQAPPFEVDAAGRNHLKARIPPESVQAGNRNTLTIALDIREWDECIFPDPRVTWFTVSPESELFLPREYLDPAAVTPLLSSFPVPFNALPNMQDVFVSLPDAASSEEIQQAFQLLARLGSESVGGLAFKPLMNMGALPDGLDLSQYHFIVLGRPSTNSLLESLNAYLPQPFAAGTDEIQQTLDNVVYRLPAGLDLGILQSLQSPWAPERYVLVITGTGPQGQGYAVRALAENLYGRGLSGNVAFLTADNVSIVDTRTVYFAEDVLTEIPALQTESAIQATETANPVYTVTPGPTFTPTVTPTATIPVTATPILPTALVPTALPTFTPLPQEALQAVVVQQPEWISTLVIITGIVLLTAIVFGLLVLARSRRNK